MTNNVFGDMESLQIFLLWNTLKTKHTYLPQNPKKSNFYQIHKNKALNCTCTWSQIAHGGRSIYA